MSKTFTFRFDSRHGWLMVTPEELADVGLTEEHITPYSYTNGHILALEEDCDAGTFVAAYIDKYRQAPRFDEEATGATIRNWNRFGTKLEDRDS